MALAGGGTGLIGDPSGKSQERQLQSKERIAANLEQIKPQLTQFLDFEVRSNPARIINNADWLTVIPMMDFLRDVGKHFTVNYMLAKDSVSTRMERQEGISYTEFSYMLLQAYDFFQLYDRYGCTLQAGGSDQWGNIIAGTELIRRVRSGRAFGLVYPLVTNADGSKLGKTERGTIWLDAKKTSPYRFYQYWLKRDRRRRHPIPADTSPGCHAERSLRWNSSQPNAPSAVRRSAPWRPKSRAWCMASRRWPTRRRHRRRSSAAPSRDSRQPPSRTSLPRRRAASCP